MQVCIVPVDPPIFPGILSYFRIFPAIFHLSVFPNISHIFYISEKHRMEFIFIRLQVSQWHLVC